MQRVFILLLCVMLCACSARSAMPGGSHGLPAPATATDSAGDANATAQDDPSRQTEIEEEKENPVIHFFVQTGKVTAAVVGAVLLIGLSVLARIPAK